MYKVFIDHKPVIFVEKKDLSTDFPKIKAKNVESVKKDIEPLMKEVTLDTPLQIVCSDVEEAFKDVFKDFKLIEAAGGLVQRKDDFLLIKRKGLWDIPKGKIDKGESPENAAVREVMEECGIDGHEITDPLVTTYHTMKFRGKPAIKRTYWYMMKYKGRKITAPQREEGITKVKWMCEDHMLSIRGRTYGSINEVLDCYKKRKKKKKKNS